MMPILSGGIPLYIFIDPEKIPKKFIYDAEKILKSIKSPEKIQKNQKMQKIQKKKKKVPW